MYQPPHSYSNMHSHSHSIMHAPHHHAYLSPPSPAAHQHPAAAAAAASAASWKSQIISQISQRNSREVGADRLMNAVGAYERCRGACVVVDFGTSINYDVVSADGEYLGGAIAPGVGISLDALVAHTAKLIRVELLAPDAVIGRSTMSAIQSGLLWGFVGQIEYMVRRMTDELGGTAHVIATGGQAGMVAGLTQVIDDVDPQLTLEGLRLIHLQNVPDGGT